MTQSDWTLYVKPHCPWCVEAVAWLRASGYDFRQVDVTREPAAHEAMKVVSGQRLTPTLVIESTGQVLPDFDVGQLEKFLKQHGLWKKAV